MRKERERSHPDHATNPEPRALWLRTLRLRLRIAPRLHPSTSSANPKPRAQSPWTLTSNRTQITPFNFASEPRAQITPSTSPRSHRDSTDRTKIAIEKWYYIFVWKLRKCEEQEENVFSILFSAIQQTLENIFQNIFWNATKHLKIFSFLENSISRKYLFSGKYFTWTKHSLRRKYHLSHHCFWEMLNTLLNPSIPGISRL